MRIGISLVLMLALTGCVTPLPVAGPTLPQGADDTCGAAPYAGLIGQNATALERVLILRQVRLLRPDTIVTMDYAADRLNFVISGNEVITAIRCG